MKWNVSIPFVDYSPKHGYLVFPPSPQRPGVFPTINAAAISKVSLDKITGCQKLCIQYSHYIGRRNLAPAATVSPWPFLHGHHNITTLGILKYLCVKQVVAIMPRISLISSLPCQPKFLTKYYILTCAKAPQKKIDWLHFYIHWQQPPPCVYYQMPPWIKEYSDGLLSGWESKDKTEKSTMYDRHFSKPVHPCCHGRCRAITTLHKCAALLTMTY